MSKPLSESPADEDKPEILKLILKVCPTAILLADDVTSITAALPEPLHILSVKIESIGKRGFEFLKSVEQFK